MRTKRELLEEKTVKELHQMARDKNLTGFSTKNKPELVEMISENYLKKEVKDWPELGLNEIGRGEKAKGIEEEESEEARVPVKEIEVDRIFGVRKDIVFAAAIVGSAAASIVVIVTLYLGAY